MPHSFRALAAFIACVILLQTGCKRRNPDAPASVSGKVTYNGSPVTGGTISFQSSDHGGALVIINPDGTFKADEVPEGELTVAIETESINPNKEVPEYKGGKSSGDMAAKYGKKSVNSPEHEEAGKMSPIPSGAPTGKGTYRKIPLRYSDPTQSNLKVTLKKGDNKQDFNLTD